MSQVAIKLDIHAAWKECITLGNHAYDAGDWSIAINQYNTALQEAERSYSVLHQAEPDTALASVVVSYLNIVSVYFAVGNVPAMSVQFSRVSDFLLRQLTLCRTVGLHEAICRAYSTVKQEWLLMHKHCLGLAEPDSMRLIEKELTASHDVKR